MSEPIRQWCIETPKEQLLLNTLNESEGYAWYIFLLEEARWKLLTKESDPFARGYKAVEVEIRKI